jgi:hypothetical protein
MTSASPSVTRTSFEPDQEAEYLQFFAANGFVVVRNVLTPQQIAQTIDEIWESTVLIGSAPHVKRHDPTTWEDDTWPASCDRGFLSSDNNLCDVSAWQNRQNPNVVRVFQLLHNTRRLSLKPGGRYGIMRPTRDIALTLPTRTDCGTAGDMLVMQRPDWRTTENWLHWDQNPLTCRGYFGLQGIITLSSHEQPDGGGFKCIPAFHQRFAAWADAHSQQPLPPFATTTVPYMVPDNDPIQREALPILMPAGSLIVWDSRLAHQNFPNESSRFRIVQYVTLEPATSDEQQIASRKCEIERILRCTTGDEAFPAVLTHLGRKIIGLDAWSSVDDEINVRSDAHINTIPPRNHATTSPEEAQRIARLKEALALSDQARVLEAAGDSMAAMAAYRKAYRLYPELEDAYFTL